MRLWSFINHIIIIELFKHVLNECSHVKVLLRYAVNDAILIVCAFNLSACMLAYSVWHYWVASICDVGGQVNGPRFLVAFRLPYHARRY